MGWNLRSRAGSFSMRLRYSSSVVAPIARSSPRARAGFRRLEASMAPSAAPAPTRVCSSSMKRMMLSLAVDDLLDHRLQPLLELPAELRAGHQAAEVQGKEALVLEGIRHVSRDDPAGKPFHDGRLADSRLADEDGVVLRAPRQHLHDAADLLVPADDRVQLLLAREVGEVPAVFFQGLVARLGVLVGDPLVAADGLERLHGGLPRDPALLQEVAGFASFSVQHCQEQVLGARELVLQARRFLLRLVQDVGEARGHGQLRRVPVDFGLALQAGAHGAGNFASVGADPFEEGRNYSVLLLHEGQEEVLHVQARVVEGVGKGIRLLQGFLRFQSHLVVSHLYFSGGNAFVTKIRHEALPVKCAQPRAGADAAAHAADAHAEGARAKTRVPKTHMPKTRMPKARVPQAAAGCRI